MSTGFNCPIGFDVGTISPIDSNGKYVSASRADYLGNRINAETSLTSNGTAVVCTWTRVNSILSDTTITLPSAAANNGKFVGIIIDQNCVNYLVTLQDSAGAYIDYDMVNGTLTGRTTRIMWAGEIAVLYSNGTYWHKVAGKTIPMFAKLYSATPQLLVSDTATLLQISGAVAIIGPMSLVTLTNPNSINIKRPGVYVVDCHVSFNNTNSANTVVVVYVYKGGNSAEGRAMPIPAANTYFDMMVHHKDTYAAGDILQPYAKYNNGTYTTATTTADSTFTVTELPSW